MMKKTLPCQVTREGVGARLEATTAAGAMNHDGTSPLGIHPPQHQQGLHIRYKIHIKDK
jgi:hypothetical protein